MSTPSYPSGEPKYYDPAEVEAYVNDATNTIKTLQARLAEASRQAEEAERALGETQPETASLGRALLLASEVADKTIADADARAAETMHAAEERAASIVAAAQAEANRLVDAAQGAAADAFRNGEARLLAAVSAFMEGSNVLREELAKVGEEATNWRTTTPPPAAPRQPGFSRPGPPPEAANGGPHDTPDLPGGIHNRAGRDSGRAPDAEPDTPVKVSPFFPPPPAFAPSDRRDAGRG